ncbi:MAG: hypothetical protein NZ992_01375 [Candidatus Korarchaeum sp.]|nr:hypothetical protein [Candidatus Korarchaeum sp.]MDW8036174.1 hypothetical protein [Candidatus Korarchaeum sp.]
MRKTSFYPLPLKNLFKLIINLRGDIDPEGVRSVLKLKGKRSVDHYVKTANWILSKVKDVSSIDDFMESLVSVLVAEYKLEDALKEFRSRAIPLTPSSLSATLKSKGYDLSGSEAKAIISWLKEAGALKERRVPVLTLSLEERVLEEVRNKGTVTYATLRRNYGDNVKQTVFSLWKKGLLSVPSLEKHRSLFDKTDDPDRILGDVKGEVFTNWQDRTSGEIYSELVIPQRERISARWQDE